MNLKLIRKIFTEESTIGELYINNIFHCFTLEDKVRDIKIQNITAIPYGKYEIIINFSNHFQKQMPLLLNVPNYEGIRIHSGNKSTDTEGCILLGSTKGVNIIGNSRVQFEKFMVELKKSTKGEKIFIDISTEF